MTLPDRVVVDQLEERVASVRSTRRIVSLASKDMAFQLLISAPLPR
jgi:hypothetical protein